MSIYTLHEMRRHRTWAIAIPSEFLAVMAVAALGLLASFAALSGGIELVP